MQMPYYNWQAQDRGMLFNFFLKFIFRASFLFMLDQIDYEDGLMKNETDGVWQSASLWIAIIVRET